MTRNTSVHDVMKVEMTVVMKDAQHIPVKVRVIMTGGTEKKITGGVEVGVHIENVKGA
jgi:hypothetical protein